MKIKTDWLQKTLTVSQSIVDWPDQSASIGEKEAGPQTSHAAWYYYQHVQATAQIPGYILFNIGKEKVDPISLQWSNGPPLSKHRLIPGTGET